MKDWSVIKNNLQFDMISIKLRIQTISSRNIQDKNRKISLYIVISPKPHFCGGLLSF